MMVAARRIELGQIDQLREFVEMEHRLIVAVFAEKGNVLAEIHVLQVIGDKTAIAALHALAEIFDGYLMVLHFLLTSATRSREWFSLWNFIYTC